MAKRYQFGAGESWEEQIPTELGHRIGGKTSIKKLRKPMDRAMERKKYKRPRKRKSAFGRLDGGKTTLG